MLLKRDSLLVILSNVDGLPKAIKDILGRQSNPPPEVYSPSSSEIQELISLASEKERAPVGDNDHVLERVRRASCFVADPSLFSQIITLCTLPQITVCLCFRLLDENKHLIYFFSIVDSLDMGWTRQINQPNEIHWNPP